MKFESRNDIFFKILTMGLLMSLPGQTAEYRMGLSDDVFNNPHRGFMLWGSNVLSDGGLPDNHHGANMYHIYIPWRMVETSDQLYDWAGIEQTYLTPITQADPDATVVIRLVADYPNGPGSGMDDHYSGGDVNRDYPLFLEQAPLNIGRNDYSSCNGDGPGVAPDWNDPNFISQAVELITAFGAQYDGDPRITAIQVGLLGLWGEWHQSGCTSIEPESAIKTAVKNAYDTAFVMTPLQTRYARDPDVTGVTFGFHEDYFPSFTTNCIYGFPLCSDSGDWNLEYGLTNVVPAARNNWQVNPISGESPLASQQDAWVNDKADITTVLNDHHFSFLGPAGKHQEDSNHAVMDRLANQLGYRFQLFSVNIDSTIKGDTSVVSVLLNNVGSAPIYHGYNLALDWVNDAEQTVDTWLFNDDLGDWLPNDPAPMVRAFVVGLNNGTYSVRAYGRPINPAGRNLVIANANRDTEGRVIVGDVTIDRSDLIFFNGFE